MDMQKIASIAAPALTPFGPAAVLIQGLHDGLVQSGMNTSVAWVPAVMSGGGMELTGFLASKMTVRAMKNQDWLSAILAGVGIVGYIAFAVTGIAKVPNSEMFGAFVGMSAIAYFAYGVYEWMTTKDQKAIETREKQLELRAREQAAELERAEKMAEIEREKLEQERKNKLVDLRIARASSGVQQVSTRPSGQNGQAQLDAVKLQWMRDFYAQNPTASLADIVAAPGCPFTSRETARKYRAAI